MLFAGVRCVIDRQDMLVNWVLCTCFQRYG